MKKFLLAATVTVAISVNLNAAKWRVNNVAGVNADFTTIQAAHNAANAGDTIYLEPSAGSYGNLTATKRLVIIGPGYFLAENEDLQANLTSSIIGTIDFNSGSDGSVLCGCTTGRITINASGILIERNFVNHYHTNYDSSILFTGSTNNTIIRNNYIIPRNFPAGYTQRAINCTGSANNVLICGNFIGMVSNSSYRYAIDVPSNFAGEISNNVIEGYVTINNTIFNNNILTMGVFTHTNSSFYNNIGNSTQFGTANGNQQNVNMTTVFVGTGSTDGQWQLSATSPALGAGVDGVDCGMFDGDHPYKLSGLPSVPAIYYHEQTIDNENQQLNVTIKAKSHN